MPIKMRGWLGSGGVVLTSVAMMAGGSLARAADEEARGQQSNYQAQTAAPGRLSEAELGNLLRAMGVEVKLEEKRYDFSFGANYNKEGWNLSMSAVLSENGHAIWVMAWLDQCPKSAADVPRTALLRLLAKNDSMGNGKFFAYIPSNNRFVLQRVVPNENMTTAKFREILQDLGASVVETYPHWSVANWKQPDRGRAAEGIPENRAKSAPAQPATETQPTGIRQTQRTYYRSDN
jgi:hypothetical protein